MHCFPCNRQGTNQCKPAASAAYRSEQTAEVSMQTCSTSDLEYSFSISSKNSCCAKGSPPVCLLRRRCFYKSGMSRRTSAITSSGCSFRRPEARRMHASAICRRRCTIAVELYASKGCFLPSKAEALGFTACAPAGLLRAAGRVPYTFM